MLIPREERAVRLRSRKRSTAVSPVIATILMVAITVVLAAVLYVLVSGYLVVNRDPRSIGIGCSHTSGGTFKCTIVSPQSGVDFQSTTIQVTTGGGDIVLSWPAPVAFGLNATGAALPPILLGRVVDNLDGAFGLGDDIYLVPVAGSTLSGLTVKVSGPGALGSYTI
jgi:flagellin-like protein